MFPLSLRAGVGRCLPPPRFSNLQGDGDFWAEVVKTHIH